jgi:hypothetical protein
MNCLAGGKQVYKEHVNKIGKTPPCGGVKKRPKNNWDFAAFYIFWRKRK